MDAKQMRRMEAMIRINQLNVGDVITEILESDIRILMGPRMEPKPIAEIRFDKDGNAHALDTNLIESIKVDGRNVLSKAGDQK